MGELEQKLAQALEAKNATTHAVEWLQSSNRKLQARKLLGRPQAPPFGTPPSLFTSVTVVL